MKRSMGKMKLGGITLCLATPETCLISPQGRTVLTRPNWTLQIVGGGEKSLLCSFSRVHKQRVFVVIWGKKLRGTLVLNPERTERHALALSLSQCDSGGGFKAQSYP